MDAEVQERDILSDRASRHRRSLMISCGVAVLVLLTGAKPDKISFPGSGTQVLIEEPEGFIIGLTVFIFYFGVAFFLEAKADIDNWKRLKLEQWEIRSVRDTKDRRLIDDYNRRNEPERWINKEEQAREREEVERGEWEHWRSGRENYLRRLRRDYPKIYEELEKQSPESVELLISEKSPPLLRTRGFFDLYLPLFIAAPVLIRLIVRILGNV